MITACELCEKITLEENLKKAEQEKKKRKVAKDFVEEVLSLVVNNFKEIPDKKFIGYRYSSSTHPELCRWFSNWEESYTRNSNLKKSRELSGRLATKEDIPFFDYDFVNEYLKDFGFQISYTTEPMVLTRYSSFWGDYESDIDSLYITANCPLEE